MTKHEQNLARIAHLKTKLEALDAQVNGLDDKLADFQQSVTDFVQKAKEQKKSQAKQTP
jgi:predicted RNase H-like nuclease (RuvC/YqgF family)